MVIAIINIIAVVIIGVEITIAMAVVIFLHSFDRLHLKDHIIVGVGKSTAAEDFTFEVDNPSFREDIRAASYILKDSQYSHPSSD